MGGDRALPLSLPVVSQGSQGSGKECRGHMAQSQAQNPGHSSCQGSFVACFLEVGLQGPEPMGAVFLDLLPGLSTYRPYPSGSWDRRIVPDLPPTWVPYYLGLQPLRPDSSLWSGILAQDPRISQRNHSQSLLSPCQFRAGLRAGDL